MWTIIIREKGLLAITDIRKIEVQSLDECNKIIMEHIETREDLQYSVYEYSISYM